MIVCHCRGVSDRAVRQSVQRGARTLSQVSEGCSAGGGCGGCRDTIAEIIAEVSSGAPASLDPTPARSSAPAS